MPVANFESEHSQAMFLDRQGEVVTLPNNALVPFARLAARSNITRIKRYHIADVYKPVAGHPKVFKAAVFDIISPDLENGPIASSAEVLALIHDCLCSFPGLSDTYEVHISHSKSKRHPASPTQTLINSPVVDLALNRIASELRPAVIEIINQTKSLPSQKRALLLKKGLLRSTADELEVLSEVGELFSLLTIGGIWYVTYRWWRGWSCFQTRESLAYVGVSHEWRHRRDQKNHTLRDYSRFFEPHFFPSFDVGTTSRTFQRRCKNRGCPKNQKTGCPRCSRKVRPYSTYTIILLKSLLRFLDMMLWYLALLLQKPKEGIYLPAPSGCRLTLIKSPLRLLHIRVRLWRPLSKKKSRLASGVPDDATSTLCPIILVTYKTDWKSLLCFGSITSVPMLCMSLNFQKLFRRITSNIAVEKEFCKVYLSGAWYSCWWILGLLSILDLVTRGINLHSKSRVFWKARNTMVWSDFAYLAFI